LSNESLLTSALKVGHSLATRLTLAYVLAVLHLGVGLGEN